MAECCPVDGAVVVRHTFFDLEVESRTRARCFSDSVVEYETKVVQDAAKKSWSESEDEDECTTAPGSSCGRRTPSSMSDVELEDLTMEHEVPMPPITSAGWRGMHVVSMIPAQAGPIPTVGVQQSLKPHLPKSSSKVNRVDKTTIVLRNLPSTVTREELVGLLDMQGLEGLYNFVYMPFDFAMQTNLGYATVNLETSYVAELAMQVLQGFSAWSDSEKTLDVGFNAPHQGLNELTAFYRNCRAMHSNVPEEFKPILVQAGVRAAMPPPTRKIQDPVL